MYKIMARSKAGTEEVDTAATKKEAETLVSEYLMAFGPGWTIWFTRS